MIDVSYNNIKSGMVSLLCSQMKEILKLLPKDDGMPRSNMRVGFVTYNNTVHFYNLKVCSIVIPYYYDYLFIFIYLSFNSHLLFENSVKCNIRKLHISGYFVKKFCWCEFLVYRLLLTFGIV